MGDDVSTATKRTKNAVILSKRTAVSIITVTTEDNCVLKGREMI
jgi:hypothetical protein